MKSKLKPGSILLGMGGMLALGVVLSMIGAGMIAAGVIPAGEIGWVALAIGIVACFLGGRLAAGHAGSVLLPTAVLSCILYLFVLTFLQLAVLKGFRSSNLWEIIPCLVASGCGAVSCSGIKRKN